MLQTQRKDTFKYLSTFTGLFCTVLIISNILDTKIFSVFGFDLPAGIIVFPLAYVFGDILTEVYGYKVSRKVIWTGFTCLLITILFFEFAKNLPSASFRENQHAFEVILGQVPRIVFASIIAYVFGEFSNSYVVAKMKVAMKGKFMWLRFVASTLIGEFIDTIIFVIIAFCGVLPWNELFPLALTGWIVKTLWELIVLPITLPLVQLIKNKEHEDYFDINTDFNPFKIS